MKILVTRPYEQAQEFAKELNKKKIIPVISPLISISSVKENITIDNPNTVILITSSNALHALSKLDKKIKIYTIGEITFKKLKSLGFINCHFLGDDVDDLRKNLNHQEEIIYLSGDQISYDFIDFPNVKRKIVYNSKLFQTPNQEFFDFFYAKEVRIITLFSLRTAKNLIYLINKNNLHNYCHDIILVCLSKKISLDLEIGAIKFKYCYYTSEPKTKMLIKLLEKIIKDEKK